MGGDEIERRDSQMVAGEQLVCFDRVAGERGEAAEHSDSEEGPQDGDALAGPR